MRSRIYLSAVCLALAVGAVPAAHGTASNGYYHKDTSNEYLHHDAWARYGTPIIDGVISAREWDASQARDSYKYDRDDNRIRYMFQYDNTNFYILAEVDDDKLWDDAPLLIGTDGNPKTWETWNDDGIEIYLDANSSRDGQLSTSDRVIAFTINGTHYRYDKGNGTGSTAYYDEITKLQRAVGINGTINNNSDTDQGYVVEIAIPWAHLEVPPAPLSYISANILILEDDDGGDLTVSYNENVFDKPFEIDRFFKWFGDGLNGPANYARIYLAPRGDYTPPSAVSGLNAAQKQPYSALLNFTAPGDDGVTGQAVAYEIRYSTSPISSEDAWNAATVFANGFMPKRGGKAESLRILGLAQNTTYHVAVRARDYGGNLGGLASVSFATTAPTLAGYGKGRIYPSPVGRYFVYENGERFMPVTQPIGLSWFTGIRDLYTRPLWYEFNGTLINWSTHPDEKGYSETSFTKPLAEKGINLYRLFIEDLAFADAKQHPNVPVPDGVAYLEFPAKIDGSGYIEETLKFVESILTLGNKYGVYVTLTPWDNYFYREDMWNNNPYSSVRGGPLNSRDEFFSNTSAYAMQKQRLEKLYERVKNHPNFFGWEIYNEWDNNTFASRDEKYEPPTASLPNWAKQRAPWLQKLTTHLRGIEKNNMIFTSSVVWQPQFGVKDFNLLSDIFDFVGIHNYTKSVEDPRISGDSDMTVRPAEDSARMVRYMTGNTVDRRPVFDLEFGPINVERIHPKTGEVTGEYYMTDPKTGQLIKGYLNTYTQEQDEETFHNVLWAEWGAGAAGMPLRWPSKVLEFRGPQLTEKMWEYQHNMALYFKNSKVDFTRFGGVPGERNVSISIPTVQRFATSDGKQGLVYLQQNTNKATPLVSGASMTVAGLAVNGVYEVEFWKTRAAPATAAFERKQATAVNGSFTVAVPAFEKSLMAGFYPAAPKGELQLRQSVYTAGDRLLITANSPVPAGKTRYVAAVIPGGTIMWLTSGTPLGYAMFSLDNLAPWVGNEVILDFPAAALPPGGYQLYMLDVPQGTTNLMNHLSALSIDGFSVQ
jgi:hypothetical protein